MAAITSRSASRISTCPADAPDDATYFVYRRLVGPDGQVAYETIDYADVEGEGAAAKVVTSSYPFSGVLPQWELIRTCHVQNGRCAATRRSVPTMN